MHVRKSAVRTAGVGDAEQRERRCQVVQPLHVGTSSAKFHAMASVMCL